MDTNGPSDWISERRYRVCACGAVAWWNESTQSYYCPMCGRGGIKRQRVSEAIQSRQRPPAVKKPAPYSEIMHVYPSLNERYPMVTWSSPDRRSA